MPVDAGSGKTARKINKARNKRVPVHPSKPVTRVTPPKAIQRGHASEGGKTIKPSTRRAAERDTYRSDAAQGYHYERAEAFKRTPAYRAALVDAARARVKDDIRHHRPSRASSGSRNTSGPRLKITPETLNALADALTNAAYIPNTGGGPSLGGGGFRTPRGAAAATVPQPIRYGQSKVARNFARDLAQLAPATFIGGYETGAGIYEAARGDTSRIERLGKEAFEGTLDTLKHPLKALEEHPLNTALTFGGATSIAGRTAGAAARAAGKRGGGPVRGRLDRAGSTVRPPIALVDDAGSVRNGQGIVERTYSKDSTRKAAQIALDRTRQPLKDADGKVVTVKQRGRMVPVLKATSRERDGGLVRHRAALAGEQANFEAGRANAVERDVRHRADKATQAKGLRGRRNKDAVALVVEGTIRSAKTFETDLRRHRARLNREYRERIDTKGFRDSAEAQANRSRVKQITELLEKTKDPKQRAKIVAAGNEVGRTLNEREKGLLKAGVLSSTDRARRARLIPAAIEHLGAKQDVDPRTGRQIAKLRAVLKNEEKAAKPRPRVIARLEREIAELEATATIRGPKGQRLTTERIETGLRSIGIDPDTVAYLPHRMDVRGRRAHHARLAPGTRPVMDKAEKRTGEAYRKGATESSAELIREQGVRQATQLAKAEQLDRIVENGALRHPNGGRYWTWKEAEEIHGRIEVDTRTGSDVFVQANGHKLVPMRAHAARLSEETQKIIREERQGPGAMEDLHRYLLNDRILHAPDGGRNARNVVLVPAAKIAQLEKHLKPSDPATKFFQILNRPFRMAVLPQPRWLAGNFAEPYIVRLTIKGSGINVFGLANDMRAANKALKVMEKSGDPKVRRAAAELKASQFGGLFVGGAQARTVRRGLEDFPNLEREYGRMVSRLPVVQNAVEMLAMGGRFALWPLKQFFHLNRVLESGAQRAAFGKQFRADLQEFTGSWSATIRLQEKAVAEAVKGLVNTPTQQRFMREQHRLLGKYEGFGPVLRWWVQGPMPFLPWALNAARFVYWTMPMQHTAVQAALLQVNEVVAKDWEELHSDLPPGSLRYALPNGKGGWIDLARYTPWGLITGGEGTVTGQVAPQFQGTLKAVQGQDPFGRELKLDPTENNGETTTSGAQRAGIAANSLAEALVPYLSTARRLQEKGGTAYAGSTVVDPDVKPETEGQMSPLNRVFNPLRPTYFGAGPARGNAPAAREENQVVDPIDRALEQIAVQDASIAEQDAAIDEALRRLAIP